MEKLGVDGGLSLNFAAWNWGTSRVGLLFAGLEYRIVPQNMGELALWERLT